MTNIDTPPCEVESEDKNTDFGTRGMIHGDHFESLQTTYYSEVLVYTDPPSQEIVEKEVEASNKNDSDYPTSEITEQMHNTTVSLDDESHVFEETYEAGEPINSKDQDSKETENVENIVEPPCDTSDATFSENLNFDVVCCEESPEKPIDSLEKHSWEERQPLGLKQDHHEPAGSPQAEHAQETDPASDGWEEEKVEAERPADAKQDQGTQGRPPEVVVSVSEGHGSDDARADEANGAISSSSSSPGSNETADVPGAEGEARIGGRRPEATESGVEPEGVKLRPRICRGSKSRASYRWSGVEMFQVAGPQSAGEAEGAAPNPDGGEAATTQPEAEGAQPLTATAAASASDAAADEDRLRAVEAEKQKVEEAEERRRAEEAERRRMEEVERRRMEKEEEEERRVQRLEASLLAVDARLASLGLARCGAGTGELRSPQNGLRALLDQMNQPGQDFKVWDRDDYSFLRWYICKQMEIHLARKVNIGLVG